MKKKIGNLIFETTDVSKCNLNNLVKTVYPIQTRVECCPICGGKLFDNYTYAIQISNTECVKITGKACLQCDAFFTQSDRLTDWLKIKKYHKGIPEFNDSYNYSLDKATNRIFHENSSVFRQFVLTAENEHSVFSVSFEKDLVKDGIIHYSHPIANQLLINESIGNRVVIINEKRYVITSIKTKKLPDDIEKEIDEAINNQILFNDELPVFSTDTTLHVYKGNIACHTRHHTIEVKVVVPFMGRDLEFYAEYCYECNKYLMKYADYETYLKRFKLFPSKISMQSKYESDDFYIYNRAEKSPLRLNGYTVSSEIGLSQDQREEILSFIIDYGVLTKRKVLDYLEMFISTNHNNPMFEQAVRKWEFDKKFVLNYSEKDTPKVIIGNVTRFR